MLPNAITFDPIIEISISLVFCKLESKLFQGHQDQLHSSSERPSNMQSNSTGQDKAVDVTRPGAP